MAKSEKYPIGKQIKGNIIIFLTSFFIAILPVILHLTSVYWDPSLSENGSGAPLLWLMYFSVPFAIIFLFISLLVYNISYYTKNKMN